VDWNATPLATITNSSSISSVVPNIGDELSYSFGVRACSATDNCDTNTTIRTVALVDRGAPSTVGVTAAIVQGGKAVLTAPWTHSNGAVAVRYVYSRQGTSGSFTLTKTFNVTDLNNPQTTLSLDDVLNGGTDYQFYVIDQDPTGNQNSNSSVIVTVNSGDVVKPVFAGITNLTYGSPTDTVAQLQWTAISRMSDDAVNGASHYLIYIQPLSLTDTPAGCSSGTLSKQVDATDTIGTTVTYNLTGLSPRTRYSICVKARDLANNISDTSAQSVIITRDLTAPIFGGLTGISYNNAQNRVELTWTASGSTDLKEYRIKVFKGSTSSPTNLQTLSMRPFASNTSGTNFNATEYSYVDNDVIFVVVDACDDASPTYGTQNCTSYSNASAMSLPIPDITPPAGFTGITTVGQVTPTAIQGQVVVNWAAPPSWTSYRGFKVYSVGAASALTEVADCACTANNCPVALTSCTVGVGSPLLAYKTYTFHVRAYDAAGNLTTYLDPAVSKANARTVDTTAPTFISSLAASGSNLTPTLTWSTATDNQQDAGSTISYTLYRKVGTNYTTNFTTTATPDAEMIASGGTITQIAINTLSTSVTDTDTLQEGQTYYYIVCAKDSSNNYKCDNAGILTKAISDATAPTIGTLNLFNMSDVAKTDFDKTWKITWSLYDAMTSTGNISVQVYKKEGTDPDVLATTTDALVMSANGATSISNQKGTAGVNRFINYLVVATDEAGNIATKNITVRSRNVFTITSVKRDKGPAAGGKLLLLKGSGFGNGMTVRIGGNLCTGVTILDDDVAYCTTPAGPDGVTLDVTATNLNNYTATLSSAYTYTSTDTCELTASGTNGFQSGAGTSGSPWTICTAAQWATIGTYGGAAGSPRYFALADNIDFGNSTIAIQSLSGALNGSDFIITRATIADPGSNNVGLFSFVSNQYGGVVGVNLQNLYLSHITVNIPARSYVGALAGISYGISIINVYGYNLNVTGSAQVGSLFGTWTNWPSDNTISNVTVNNSSITGAGWYVGGAIGEHSSNSTLNNIQVKNSNIVSSSNYHGGVVGITFSGNKYNLRSLNNLVTNSAAATGVGGIVGGNHTSGCMNIYRSINTSRVNAPAASGVGGIMGANGGDCGLGRSIYQSYSTGDIDGAASVGGIIGALHSGNINNNYVGGKITVWGNGGGGISGFGGTYRPFHIVFPQIVAKAGSSNVGSVMGNPYSSMDCTGVIAAYDATDATFGTQLATTRCNNHATSSYWAVTRNLTQMRSQATFTALGYDFVGESTNGTNDYWTMPPNNYINNGYPILNGVTPTDLWTYQWK